MATSKSHRIIQGCHRKFPFKQGERERGKKTYSVQLFSISISARRIFLGDSEQVIDISNIVIHRKNGLLVNVSPLGAARESARSLFNLMAELVAGFVPRAGFEVAGYLWLDVLEVDINVGYCKHLTVRISIRRQLRATAPRE